MNHDSPASAGHAPAAHDPASTPVIPAGGRPARSSGSLSALGAVSAVAAAFPLAALTALVYQFPVPFVGPVSGLSGAASALFGLFFYGLLGGFILLPLLGAAGGLFLQLLAPNHPHLGRLTCGWGILIAATAVISLAVLHRIIGPW
jgi:hypothetical protein